MTGEVIKSFLVGLGYDIDESSLSKFNKSIAESTLKVTALYASIKVASAGIVAGIANISEGFEKMGYEYRLITPAINKAIILRRELLKSYAAAGLNIQKAVVASVKLNMSLTKTRFALEAIYKSVGSRFFGLLTKQSDLFRQKIYANMPKIQATLEKFVQVVFKALQATTELGTRLWSILGRIYDFFALLHSRTQGWSTAIIAAIAAWRLLNLSFLATPLGAIIAGLVAILALFDDFKVWQEGGKSLFNWSSFVPVINSVSGALSSVYDVLVAIAGALYQVVAGFGHLISGDFSGFWQSFGNGGDKIIETFERLWDVVKGVVGSLGSIGTWLSNLPIISKFLGAISNSNLPNNLTNGAFGTTTPIGSQVQNQSSQTNQHVTQQTNINVQSSADAASVGKSIASEQTQVNFDLARNMRAIVK